MNNIRYLIQAPTAVVRVPLPPELAELTPASVGLHYTTVDLGGNPAWVVPGRRRETTPLNVMNAWVIFIHGRGGERGGFLDMLPIVHAMGFNSLVMTYRNDLGAASSPDGLDHLGATEWHDLARAVAYVTDNGLDSPQVVLFARSAGAAIVGQFLHHSAYACRITRVIFDNPVLDWMSVFLNSAPEWLPPSLGKLIVRYNMRRIGADIAQFNMLRRPPEVFPPTLILHAGDDEVCPVWVSMVFANLYPKLVSFVQTLGGHEGGRFKDTDRYMQHVIAFLAEHELVAPA